MINRNFHQVAESQSREIIPNSYVQSCSECCFEKGPDGGPNILGMLQKQMCTVVIDNVHGHREFLDCSKCPVHLATFRRTAKIADGRTLYWKGTDQALTENDLIKLEEDGDDIALFCDIR